MNNSWYKKYSEKIILLILSVTMVRIPLTHYICMIKGMYYSNMAKIMYICCSVCLAFFLVHLYTFRKRIKISPYEYIFLGMISLQLISCINAILPQKAIYGEEGRNEGLLMLLCYYLLFYTARLIAGEETRRSAIKIFLAIMAVHALYGLGQFYELEWRYFIHDYYHYAISGVAGNPNFMGSLMVMACAASIGMAIYSEKSSHRLMYSGLFVMFAATLIFTKTVSAYMGLGVVILILFAAYMNHICKTKGARIALFYTLGLFAAAAAGMFIVDKIAYGIISAEISGIVSQLQNGIDIETVASGRLLIWTNIFKMLPQYLLFGVGIDGLEQPYLERYGLFQGVFLDKAHNELLQVLITMGLPVMICYILIYRLVLKDISKRLKSGANKAVDYTLLLIFAGYISQAMFNISVIDVAPYFWIMLGLSARPLTE